MKVRILVGRFYGQVREMPYAEATAAIASGTAALPEADVTNIRGAAPIKGSVEAVEINRMMTDYPTEAPKKTRGRKPKA